MTNVYIILLCLFLSGCAASSAEQKDLRKIYFDGRGALTRIDTIQTGMSFSEVAGIMGGQVNIGYRQSPAMPTALEAVTVKNPYRAEILNIQGRTYQAVYYFTSIQKADGMISDDELTPLVFDEDTLIAKGWDALLKLKAGEVL